MDKTTLFLNWQVFDFSCSEAMEAEDVVSCKLENRLTFFCIVQVDPVVVVERRVRWITDKADKGLCVVTDIDDRIAGLGSSFDLRDDLVTGLP